MFLIIDTYILKLHNLISLEKERATEDEVELFHNINLELRSVNG